MRLCTEDRNMDIRLDQLNKKAVLVYFILATVLLGIYHLKDNIVVSLGNSLNYSLFIKNTDTPIKGDYVTFYKVHPYFSRVSKDNKLALTKKIICIEGDELTTRGDLHYCNGEPIAQAKDRTGKGNPLTIYEYNGVIPNSMAYVIGENNTSFDSRYFGFINIEELEKVRPIL